MKNVNGRFRFWDYDKKEHIWSDKVLQMSATDISNCQDCEFKLFHKLTQEIKFPKNAYLIMGSVFHSVIEKALRYKINKGRDLKWEEIRNGFENIWAYEKQNCEFVGKLTEEQAKAKCENYVHNYILKMLPMLYPLNNECIEKFFRVYITFGEERLGITGKIDMIGRDMWITDHKTSFSNWAQNEADEEIQAQLYPFCMKNLGYNILGFKFNVCSGHNVDVFPVEYNQTKVKKILTMAFQIKERIENNVMLKSKSKRTCGYCNFNNICKVKLL